MNLPPLPSPVFAHPAPPDTGERAELIHALRSRHLKIDTRSEMLKAADMLEADTQLFKQLTDAVDANARLLEALKRSHNLILHIEDVLPDESLDLIDVTCWNAATSDMHTGAQQVVVPAQREPLIPSELHLVYCNDLSAGDWHRAKENYVAGFTAAERHHGIGAKK